jgi:hypothetical protein
MRAAVVKPKGCLATPRTPSLRPPSRPSPRAGPAQAAESPNTDPGSIDSAVDSRASWWLHARGSTMAPAHLLSVSAAMRQTPEASSAKPGASPPSVFRFTHSHEPGTDGEGSRQLVIHAPAHSGDRYPAITFSCAPAGTVPVSTYRQSATSNLRASATMPILRARRLPPPNRRWYHCVSALVG